MHRTPVLLLVLASCLWVGCGRKTKTIVAPDGSKTTVTQNGSEVTFQGANGETVRVAGGEGGVALPEGFPEDVPIYTGAKVMTSAKSNDATTVVLTTADPIKLVLDFYNEKLKAGGWQIQTSMNSADGGMVNAAKDKRICTISAGRSDNQTTISLGVTAVKE